MGTRDAIRTRSGWRRWLQPPACEKNRTPECSARRPALHPRTIPRCRPGYWSECCGSMRSPFPQSTPPAPQSATSTGNRHRGYPGIPVRPPWLPPFFLCGEIRSRSARLYVEEAVEHALNLIEMVLLDIPANLEAIAE